MRHTPKKTESKFFVRTQNEKFHFSLRTWKIWRGAWGMLLLLSFEVVTVVLSLNTITLRGLLMRRHDTSLDNNPFPTNRLNVMSTAMHYQRMHQQHQRQGNHLDRLSYPQQCKAQTSRRPNVGNELLTKLEQAGKVPSREKFRRMCCQVCSLR
jgi:hypothetical protein